MDWSNLGGTGLEVLNFLLPVLSSAIVIVLSALAKKWVDKLGLERSERVDTMIDKYVGLAIHAAERTATKKIGGMELDGRDKLSLATRTVLGELEQSGLKGIGEELIKARIESYLEVRNPESKFKGN
ncbi:MAG TPA: phage holin, LLH family [Desulfosporosinus sp.]|nr:phage holin, LLH family [Desulfosporosinus sp.]